MYTLDEKQIAAAENFIKALPDIAVKGSYETWLERTIGDGRITPNEMEGFVALSHALPSEFQDFPQHFALCVKNGTELDYDFGTSTAPDVAKNTKHKTKKK